MVGCRHQAGTYRATATAPGRGAAGRCGTANGHARGAGYSAGDARALRHRLQTAMATF